jgi:hypothetical protein
VLVTDSQESVAVVVLVEVVVGGGEIVVAEVTVKVTGMDALPPLDTVMLTVAE